MYRKAIIFAAALIALPCFAAPSRAAQPSNSAAITGDYAEFRNADVYTGPCFANSEEGLVGDNAVLAWHVRDGAWSGVPLAGLSVVAVVRASGTLGDPYSNPLPARAFFIVDARADETQRAALIQFAQAQAPALLGAVVGVQAEPISFAIPQHGYAVLQAGSDVHLATRMIAESDKICHNEVTYYPPLAQHLEHSMPVVALNSSYSGSQLGVTWDDSGRRSSFIGTFAE